MWRTITFFVVLFWFVQNANYCTAHQHAERPSIRHGDTWEGRVFRDQPRPYHKGIAPPKFLRPTCTPTRYHAERPNFAWSKQVGGKFLQGRLRPQPWSKILWNDLLMRDLFAIAIAFLLNWLMWKRKENIGSDLHHDHACMCDVVMNEWRIPYWTVKETSFCCCTLARPVLCLTCSSWYSILF